jgi:hypothetical protein
MAQANDYIKTICKMSTGATTCKYLAMDSSGFICGKVIPAIKGVVDSKVPGEMRAQGDNCAGQRDLKNAVVKVKPL